VYLPILGCSEDTSFSFKHNYPTVLSSEVEDRSSRERRVASRSAAEGQRDGILVPKVPGLQREVLPHDSLRLSSS